MKTDVNSVSLNPSKSCFVAGGVDFLMYKHDYETGDLLGEQILNQKLFIIIKIGIAIFTGNLLFLRAKDAC